MSSFFFEVVKYVLAVSAKQNLDRNHIVFEHIKRLETMLEDNSLHMENESGSVINKLQTGIYQADLFIAK